MKLFATIIQLFLVLTPTVWAQEAAAAEQPKPMNPMIGILLMVGVFYFLIILPQQRKAKKHASFLTSLQKGDAVVTQAGIYGRIVGVAERVITLEVAQGVKIRIDRTTISGKDPTGGDKPAEAA